MFREKGEGGELERTTLGSVCKQTTVICLVICISDVQKVALCCCLAPRLTLTTCFPCFHCITACLAPSGVLRRTLLPGLAYGVSLWLVKLVPACTIACNICIRKKHSCHHLPQLLMHGHARQIWRATQSEVTHEELLDATCSSESVDYTSSDTILNYVS